MILLASQSLQRSLRTFASRRPDALLVALALTLTAGLLLEPAGAAPLRLPSTPIELDPTGEPDAEPNGEQPERIGPLRARPAPAAGVAQPSGQDAALAPANALVGPLPGPSRSFEGISNAQQSTLFPTASAPGTLKLPADTTGDIGRNHYVQAVNTSYSVFSRDGTLIAGPIPFADTFVDSQVNGTLFAPGLFSGSSFDPGDASGLYCDDHNRGDPVVLYDESAGRWVIAQFAFALSGEVPTPPFKQCVAVSKGEDPTAGWWLYEFELSNNLSTFPDYPKLGVWNDAYYLSANSFDLTQSPAGAAGGFAVALERSAMLVGGSARMVTDPSTQTDKRFFGLLPADVDGADPPPDAPGLFLVLEDDNYPPFTVDGLRLWSASVVNWSDPNGLDISTSRFMQIAPVDSMLCNQERNCIPQPPVPGATYGLDPLSGQLLHRLAYRNFGSRQTLVATHVADANSPTNHAGMRWYELQNAGSGWSVVQTSTFAPDEHHRWMGSIAMDASGNIGLGYSTSSATRFPSINYSGRFASDPLSVMTQGEGTIVAGGGSQKSNSSRWGDYSTLSVDPTDGCTFWFTNLYYPVEATALWHTRIGSFSLVSDPALISSTHPPGTWSSNRYVEAKISDARANCGIAGFSTAWSGDPDVPADAVVNLDAAATSVWSPKLAEGEHYLRVRTIDAKGNAGPGSTLGPLGIDRTPPSRASIDPTRPEPFQTTRRFPVAWSAEDALSGVASFDVRYRQAAKASGFGARKGFRSKTRKSKASFVGKPGSTYCFAARAYDRAANRSRYGKEHCTAVPLDDRMLRGRQDWKALKRKKAYRRTALLTTRRGATLSARGVRARTLALIATRCGRCGTVEVRHAGRLVGTVDLATKPYGAGLVNKLPGTKRVRNGSVTMTVVSSGRRVVIDGLGINRIRVTE